MAAGYDGDAGLGGSGGESIITSALLGPDFWTVCVATFALDRLSKCCEHKLLFR
jgi:hypothetical protein